MGLELHTVTRHRVGVPGAAVPADRAGRLGGVLLREMRDAVREVRAYRAPSLAEATLAEVAVARNGEAFRLYFRRRDAAGPGPVPQDPRAC